MTEINEGIEIPQPIFWPAPKRCIRTKGSTKYSVSGTLSVYLSSWMPSCNLQDIIQIWQLYERDFETLGYSTKFLTVLPLIQKIENEENPREDPFVVCSVSERLFGRKESYWLQSGDSELQLQASDSAGLHSAIRSLLLVCSQGRGEEGALGFCIQDWPVYHHRAFRINLSLNSTKIPTKETLHHLIKSLAALRFNQFHLLCSASPENNKWPLSLSSTELLELQSFCSRLGIEVIPGLEATTMTSSDDLEALRAIYEQFVGAFFEPRFIYVGRHLKNLLLERCHLNLEGLHSWGHFIPVSLQRTTFLIQDGLEGEQNLSRLHVVAVHEGIPQSNKMPFLLGLSSCLNNSLSGCSGILSGKSSNLFQAAQDHPECLGSVVDLFPSQNQIIPLPLTFPSLVTVAGLSWGVKESTDLAWVLNSVLFKDKENLLGGILIDLGVLEAELVNRETSVFYLMLTDPDKAEFEKNSAAQFQKMIRSLNQIQSQLQSVSTSCIQREEMMSEIQLTLDLALLACRLARSLVTAGSNPDASLLGFSVINPGITNLPSTARTDLANKLLGLMEQFCSVWSNRFQSQNFSSAMLTFQNLLNKLVPEEGL